MIYAEHNFTSNFFNAVGTDNDFISEQILIDELARLIVEDKKDVVNLLRKYNIGATINDPNNKIANYVTNEIVKNNLKFTNEISNLIVKKSVNETELKADGKLGELFGKILTGTKEVLSNKDVQEAASALIANKLQQSYNKQTTSQTQTNQEVLGNRLQINQIKSDTKTRADEESKKKSVKIAIIAISSIVTVGIITILLIKLKQKNQNG